MALDVVRDDLPIVSGSRMLPNSPLIPYRYLESGNFVLITEGDEYPFYTKFGDSQTLVYVTDVELEALRNE
jgi:hypothetical protein